MESFKRNWKVEINSMVTKEYPEFFRVLSGSNAPLYENIIVSLYDEINLNTMGQITVDRPYLRNLIYKEMKKFDFDRISDESANNSVQAHLQAILNRFTQEGWIEAKYDSLARDHIYNFTRNGRKFAQILHQMNSKFLTTRHRNVRTTLSFLKAYRDKGDPYDLVDATDASEYIVGDLMDQINEIHDVRKRLVKQAMEDIKAAGENFFEFLEKDFASSISVHLTEDSVSKHAASINAVINDIMESIDTMKERDKRLIERFPNLEDTHSPVENYLNLIYNRVQSARDQKIPELLDAIEALFKSSKMVLKQAGSLLAKNSSSVKMFASLIREGSDEEKQAYLNKFRHIFGLLSTRHLDPEKVVIKKRNTQRSIKSTIEERPEPSPEILRDMQIRDAIRKSIGYSSVEVEDYIMSVLEEEESTINAYMPIKNFKELNMSLHAAAVALKTGLYDVETDGTQVHNRYYSVDKYTITKKEKE